MKKSLTKPGEVVFNLLALLCLVMGGFLVAHLINDPPVAREWWFWLLLAGPGSFWAAVVTILVRLLRSGYRPRFRFGRGLSITGSRDCYDVYRARFGRAAFAWLIVGPVWFVLSFFLLALR